jgi:hypothetical protein
MSERLTLSEDTPPPPFRMALAEQNSEQQLALSL